MNDLCAAKHRKQDHNRPRLQIAPNRRIVDYRYIDDRVFMPKQKLIPLPSAAFQILLALAGDDLHGYGIMRQVAEHTEAREDAKLGHGRRRYYRLTSAGRKLARSEAERLADLLRLARAKKILRGEYV
jgi:DNA-binding PadR family transcriptional regulator